MFMADLCYIFIYIIKWFLKSPACLRSHTKTILIEACLLLNKYDKKKYFGIFEKETSKSNMTVSNKSISGIACEHETTGDMQCIQHVNKC